MLDDLLDLLLGARCAGCGLAGRVLCHSCAATLPTEAHEAVPSPCPPGLVGCRVAGEYDGLLRALLLAHKEQQVFGLARELGRLLALAVAQSVVGQPHQRTALVPVPTRRSMIRARGHDPTARIVRSAATLLRSCGHDVIVLPLLRHRLPVRDQAGLNSAERVSNRRDTLGLSPTQRAALERLDTLPTMIVCDDVLTTGATAREAQRALNEAGVAVASFAAVAATRRKWTEHSGCSG